LNDCSEYLSIQNALSYQLFLRWENKQIWELNVPNFFDEQFCFVYICLILFSPLRTAIINDKINPDLNLIFFWFPVHIMIEYVYQSGIQSFSRMTGSKVIFFHVQYFVTVYIVKITVYVIARRMINTLVYYGLSMSAGSIVGHRYGNFILCSLVEIPALVLVIKILNNYGRRESQCVTLLLCSSLCFSIAFIPSRKYIIILLLPSSLIFSIECRRVVYIGKSIWLHPFGNRNRKV